MLLSLFISNYALIDKLEIEFSEGLNIITGETGAGKSIVLGALSLLCGERADFKTIRDEKQKTIVEARFDIENLPEVKLLLKTFDLDADAPECILRRELTSKGTSRSFINDTPVNLVTLKSVSDHLIDIHSQHENLLLVDSDFQLKILDSLACNEEILSQYAAELKTYKAALKKYVDFRDRFKRLEAEHEFNTYQLEQLNELDLKPGEQQQLEQEREIVANAAELKRHLNSALEALSGKENNALELLSKATEQLRYIAEVVSEFSELLSRLKSAQVEIADIAETLSDYDLTISSTSADLETIENRLSKIYSLQARHNVTTDEALIVIHNRLKASNLDMSNGPEKLAALEKTAKEAKRKLVKTAQLLTESRTAAARQFEEMLIDKARPLGMSNLRCSIRITPDKLKNNGSDNVQFLFAFNKNQPLMPVGKTASGGEIARLILALKSIMVEKMNLPTVIFDEIDTGVSGDVANRMAKLMLEISDRTQVIAITHIATVAAHGKRHFKIFKKDDETATHTYIEQLSDKERLAELAIMISGDRNDVKALQTARTLIESAGTRLNKQ